MSRILVKGSYINPSTYILVRENGSVFQKITEGEPFVIDNQMRSFVPVRVRKKNGHGTILMCRKFGDYGNVIEEFPLRHNKVGLWATSSGSARNGVFHTYHEPQTALERQLASMSLSRHIIEVVPKIDEELEIGGQLCSHCVKKWGFGVSTDGQIIHLTEPQLSTQPGYHFGCMESTYLVNIVEATYLIYYSVHTAMNGIHYRSVDRIIVNPDVDEDILVEYLKKI